MTKKIALVFLLSMVIQTYGLISTSQEVHAKVSETKILETKPLNINLASEKELTQLPGVGKQKARAIIKYRKTNPFQKIEDVMKVKGIGKEMFKRLQSRVRVK